MADEKNVTKTAEPKTALSLTVNFERKVFKGEDGRETAYVQCTADYLGESFRFKVTDKDARLFQYLMKSEGYPLIGADGLPVKEG